MNKFRLFVYFILSLIAVTAAVSFYMPVSQKIKKSVAINAPAAKIYKELMMLENFNRISVWGAQDSTLQYTLSGTDGTIGATSFWKGSPEISGEGTIAITALEPARKIAHAISFTTPKKGTATSEFILTETDKDKTTVDWNFTIATPRPWNIFNLFYSAEKQMGADFEKGLAALKLTMDSGTIK
jgi:Polyketide cyclase / dehydrase and lipid transport